MKTREAINKYMKLKLNLKDNYEWEVRITSSNGVHAVQIRQASTEVDKATGNKKKNNNTPMYIMTIEKDVITRLNVFIETIDVHSKVNNPDDVIQLALLVGTTLDDFAKFKKAYKTWNIYRNEQF